MPEIIPEPIRVGLSLRTEPDIKEALRRTVAIERDHALERHSIDGIKRKMPSARTVVEEGLYKNPIFRKQLNLVRKENKQ